MSDTRVDLYSDTQTQPTEPMRQAMATAEVGDEQRRLDPTVNQLVERVCELLGKDDAMFLPTGTMCNQIAWRVHCRPGDEVIMDTSAHTRNYETGGIASLSGTMPYPLMGKKGIFTADQVEAAIRPSSPLAPRSRALLVEQTSNLGGGTIWPIETIKEVCHVAASHGLALHMDGARLFNAVVATGIPAKDYAAHFDSVFVDFSKGLGAPVGGALAGSKDFITEAWRWKHQFGGAMRQAGIIAAGALYGLDHHIEQLARDHDHAQMLFLGLNEIEGIRAEPAETNMVFFDVAELGCNAETFTEQLAGQGILLSIMGPTRIRAVTHLGVSRKQIENALRAIQSVADDLSD